VRHWVIDEAHAFEAEARRQWAIEVSGEESRTGFEMLGGVKTGVLHGIMVNSSSLEGSELIVRLLTKVAASVARAQVSVGDFFCVVHDLSSIAKGDTTYDNVSIWIDEEHARRQSGRRCRRRVMSAWSVSRRQPTAWRGCREAQRGRTTAGCRPYGIGRFPG